MAVCTGDSTTPGQVFIRDVAAGKTILLAGDQRVTMAAFCPASENVSSSRWASPRAGPGRFGSGKRGRGNAWSRNRSRCREPSSTSRSTGMEAASPSWGRTRRTGEGSARSGTSTQPGKPKDYLSSSGYVHVGAINQSSYSADGKLFAIACGDEGADPPRMRLQHRRPRDAAGIVLDSSSSRQPGFLQPRWQEARHGQRRWNCQGLGAPGGTDRQSGDDAQPRQFGSSRPSSARTVSTSPPRAGTFVRESGTPRRVILSLPRSSTAARWTTRNSRPTVAR